jgi:hypothetical protein
MEDRNTKKIVALHGNSELSCFFLVLRMGTALPAKRILTLFGRKIKLIMNKLFGGFKSG